MIVNLPGGWCEPDGDPVMRQGIWSFVVSVVAVTVVAMQVAVRYAWALDHPWANLLNKDGLPSVTFRSDTW